MLEVKRSPAKVSWHLLCNGIFITATPTKQECEDLKVEYATRYGLGV